MSKIVLAGGLGYPYTETQAGLPTLKMRFEALGISTIIVPHTGSQAAYDFLKGYVGFKAMLGDSLGAGAVNDFAQQLDEPIDFVGGFQPSNYDPLAKFDPEENLYYLQVPRNVKFAHCIRNPNWFETVGLGNATYERVPGDKQPCLVTLHNGTHPDDWGYTQDIMVNQVKGMLK